MMSGGPVAAPISIPAAQDPAAFLNVVNLLLASPGEFSPSDEPVDASDSAATIAGRLASPSQIAGALIRSMWRATSTENVPPSAAVAPGTGGTEYAEAIAEFAANDLSVQSSSEPDASAAESVADPSLPLDGDMGSFGSMQIPSRKSKARISALDTALPQTNAADLPLIAKNDAAINSLPMATATTAAPGENAHGSQYSSDGMIASARPNIIAIAANTAPLPKAEPPMSSQEKDVAFRAKLTEKPAQPEDAAAAQPTVVDVRPRTVPGMTVPRTTLPRTTLPLFGSVSKNWTNVESGKVENLSSEDSTNPASIEPRAFTDFAGESSNGDSLEGKGEEHAAFPDDGETAVVGGTSFADAAGALSFPVADKSSGTLDVNPTHAAADPARKPDVSMGAPAETNSKTPSPTLKPSEIAVRVIRPDAHPVDVQVRQRAGEIHVAVRTPDVDLQRSLRDGLPELVHSLDRAGFHTDTLTGGGGNSPHLFTQDIPARADVSMETRRDLFSRDDGERNFQGPPQQGGQSSGDNSRDARERLAWNWLEQMEE